MPDPNMTYQDHLEMFGTEEEKKAYAEREARLMEWLKPLLSETSLYDAGFPKPKENP